MVKFRAGRRAQVLLSLVGLFAGLAVAFSGQASAATGGGCSGYVESGYHWAQAACLGWDGTGMTADNVVSFETGFNRGNVISCTLEGTLVASYGTTHTYYLDCYNYAIVGGVQEIPGPGSDLLGPGLPGASYSWHACMIVYTGSTYDSCGGPHPVSPALHV